MFIRVKSTPNSPRKSVQICKNVRHGNKVCQKVIRHVGIAQNEVHLIELKQLALAIKNQLKEALEGPFLFPVEDGERPVRECALESEAFTGHGPEGAPSEHSSPLEVDLKDLSEEKRVVEGFHDIFGRLFHELGFHSLLGRPSTDVLKNILLARIANPCSKHRTQSILAADFGKDIPLERIYRMMDALFAKQEEVQKRVFAATEQFSFGEASLLLFDVTTLYFESVEVDEIRNFGYSKDQQFHTTQVVLALATTSQGLPIGYKVFSGNTAEVSTLLACLEEWRRVLTIGKVVFVGDRAMMTEKNLQLLEQANITYVVGAKLKRMPKPLQENILQGKRQIKEEELAIQEFSVSEKRKLIVSHSLKRAAKDKKDRERGIEKIHKRIGKGKNIKKLIPNYGCQKYLKIEGEGKLVLDEGKIQQEEIWDGFHGIITNDMEAEAKELLSHYSTLWVIEESFRIQKHNLSIRPIYHFKPERVQAHILLCYMAFTMIRHLEYRMKMQQQKMSIEEIREELWRVQSGLLKSKKSGKWYRIPSKMTPKSKQIYQVFGIKRMNQPGELKEFIQ